MLPRRKDDYDSATMVSIMAIVIADDKDDAEEKENCNSESNDADEATIKKRSWR